MFFATSLTAQIKVWNNNHVTTGFSTVAPSEQLFVRGDFYVIPQSPTNTDPLTMSYITGGNSSSGFYFTNYAYSSFNEPMIRPQWGMTMWVGNSSNYLYRVFAGEIYNSAGIIQTSDRRLKMNIKPWSESALDRLMRLKAYRYDMDASKYENVPDYKKEQLVIQSKNKIGFIAQELQEEFPEMVSNIPDSEYLGVNYSMMIPVLLEAIKEQQQLILELQAKVEALENK